MMDIYIGTRMVASRDVLGRCWRQPVQSFEHGLDEVARRLALQRWWLRGRQRLWWSGALCRPFVFDIPAGANGQEDLEAVAAALAPQRVAIGEPCRLWAGQLRPGLALGVAMAQATWQATLQALGASPAKAAQPAWAGPWWSLVLRQALAPCREGVLLHVRDCDSLTLLMADRDGLQAATTYAPVTGDQQAELAWRRAQVLLPHTPAQASMQVIMPGNDVPPAQMRKATIAYWGALKS